MRKPINISFVIELLAEIFSIGLNSTYAKEAKKVNPKLIHLRMYYKLKI
jgi:hypothetical protein